MREVDHGAKDLLRRIYGLQKPRIEVGILGADAEKPKTRQEGDEGDATLLDVAIFNEFGTDTIPERSFLRAYFDEHDTDLRDKAKRLLALVVKGALSKDTALEQLGLYAVGEIQKRIASGIDPENEPSTVRQKGSSTPLVDTGQLRQNISHRVVTG